MKKSYTVDDKTFATTPGNVILQPFVWFKNNSANCSILVAALIFTIIFTFYFSFWFLIPVIFFLFINVFYWRRKIEHFKFGDSNGGIIISETPMLIAVATDLTKGVGKYPVLKIIPYNKKGKIGDKVGTVALYTSSTDSSVPHWLDFNPIPIDYATTNRAEIDRAMQSYSAKQWSELDRKLLQLKKPFAVGLFKVDVESSDWNAT